MKKVLIINDTSSECHHGCDLVMTNLRKILTKYNVRTFSVFSGKTLIENKNLIKKLDNIDLVLINGEGTLNNSQERAKNIIKDLIYLKENYNFPVVLINSTIYRNNSFIMKNLKLFDLIYVRSSLDKELLFKHRIVSKVVPDISFYAFPKIIYKNKKDNKNFSITDSYSNLVSENFLKFSKKYNFNFLPIRRDPKLNSLNLFKILSFAKFHFIKIIVIFFLKLKININYNFAVRFFFINEINDYLKNIKNSDLLICGRFHALSFAIQTLTPFCFIKSSVNTHKSESLLKDIGIKNRVIELNEFNIEKFKKFKKREIVLIKKYLNNSNYKINKMFKEIFQLVHKKS